LEAGGGQKRISFKTYSNTTNNIISSLKYIILSSLDLDKSIYILEINVFLCPFAGDYSQLVREAFYFKSINRKPRLDKKEIIFEKQKYYFFSKVVRWCTYRFRDKMDTKSQ